MRFYDDPKVQNPSFYGSLDKVLQFKAGMQYEKVITLLVSDELVYTRSDQGKVRLFDDIAVKPGIDERPVRNRKELHDCLRSSISGSNIFGEIDLADDGNVSISFPSDIEAVIVDNQAVGNKVESLLRAHSSREMIPKVYISELPRNDPGDEDFDF